MPFASQAVLVAFGAVLVSRIVVPPGHTPSDASGRQQIVEGVRWLWAHAPVRTLTITIVSFNVTFGAAWSVLVLYSHEHLGLGDFGFGILTAMTAVGGIVGSWSYRRIEQRVSLADIIRVGLIIETLTHVTLAVTRLPAVAMGTLFVFGIHTWCGAPPPRACVDSAVQIDFQGHVASVYMMGVNGGIVVGATIEVVIATQWGVTAPFWFTFGGSAVILTLLWQQLGNIAHHDAATWIAITASPARSPRAARRQPESPSACVVRRRRVGSDSSCTSGRRAHDRARSRSRPRPRCRCGATSCSSRRCARSRTPLPVRPRGSWFRRPTVPARRHGCPRRPSSTVTLSTARAWAIVSQKSWFRTIVSIPGSSSGNTVHERRC